MEKTPLQIKEKELERGLSAYIAEKHTQEECVGFIAGYEFAFKLLLNYSDNISRVDILGILNANLNTINATVISGKREAATEIINALIKGISIEKSCSNCTSNGNQCIYPSKCTGCGADEEFLNWTENITK